MLSVHASWDAATLGERVAHLRRRPANDSRQHDARESRTAFDDALAAWARACALGKMDALLRRLSWDQIDPDVARAAMTSDAPDDFPIAPWISAASDFAVEAGQVAPALGTPEWERDLPPSALAIPFVEAWWPILRVARRRLRDAAPHHREWLSDEAIAALEIFLLRELSGTGELALFEDFRDRRGEAEADSASAARYDAYVQHLLTSGYHEVFSAFPVLARHLVLLVDQWVDYVRLLAARLEQDRTTIERVFGQAAGQAARVTPGLSDRHAGGRRVAAVEFHSGLRVAYKPREVRLERAFQAWLSWLEQAGADAMPSPIRVVDCDTHGWAEWVEQEALESRAAVEAYFRATGALVCLTYVLGATDLHGENLIASSRGPALVDTEMLLQPSARAEADAPLASCLSSGLVSFVVVDRQGRTFDVGGLQPSAPRDRSVPGRRWIDVRTDGIRFAPESRVHPVLRNDVIANGVRQRPEGFVDAVCAGFASAYRFLASNRERVLTPGGPLRGFADCRTRVLFRPSDQYAAAQYLMAAPRYQRRGVDRSLAIETFHQVFATDAGRPALWPAVYDERQALECLDVPRVTVPTAATDLAATTGDVSRDFYARSGLDAARDRLSRLDDEELARQLDQLRTALGGYDEVSASPPRARATATDAGGLLAAAEQIGHAILARSRAAPGDALSWPSSAGRIDLYAGASGIGLFLAALAAVTGGSTWCDASQRVWRGVEAEIAKHATPAPGIGACSGTMSVAYAMAVAGYWLDDARAVARAAAHATVIPLEAIDEDLVLDVDGGAAGALLTLLAVHDLSPDDRLIAMARRCVSRLLDTQIRIGPDRGAWPSGSDARARPGFAHGAAGIASALCRYAAQSDDPDVRDAVREAWGYERRVFADNDGGWPAVRRDGGRVTMTAWCHGAPGIALARAGAPASMDDPDLAAEIDIAMRQTLSAAPAPFDHLCCGNLGRADIALTVGRRRGVSAWIDYATSLSQTVARRVRADGRRGMRGRGVQRGAPEPELFQGLAGIGYQLLRSASSTLPSILAFEAPALRPIAAETC